MSPSSRREFLQNAGQGIAGAAVLAAGVHTAREARAADANDRFSIGLIGPGGMGSNHLKLLASNKEVRFRYVCDVDAVRLSDAVKSVESISGEAPQGVKDMRQVFDDKSIDAVWIATPDHWHAPATILALDAGKHVYVEKPCSHNIREGRLMIEAAKRNKKIVQVGTQSRSTAHIMQGTQRLREGVIGDVLVAKAWNSQLRNSIGHAEPSEPPPTLDFDLWLGPTPKVPYQTNLLPGIWRWWHAFGAGDMGNDGVHDIDIARWGLGVETHPSEVAALGGKLFFTDDQQFPDTQFVAFDYPANDAGGRRRQLIYEQRIWSPYVQEGFENGNAFYGTEGMMLLGKSGGYKVFGRKNKLIEEVSGGSPDLPAHHADFLACARTGAMPRAAIEINHFSTSLCHLGNLATRFGRVLKFDPQAERIVGDEEVGPLVGRRYRDHWATPKGA